MDDRINGDHKKRLRLKMQSPADVRRAMTRVANLLLNDEIDSKKANALIYAGNAVLNSLRTDEFERELEALKADLRAEGYLQ